MLNLDKNRNQRNNFLILLRDVPGKTSWHIHT